MTLFTTRSLPALLYLAACISPFAARGLASNGTYDNGAIRFEYPASWTVSAVPNQPSVIVRAPGGREGQNVAITWQRLKGQCALAAQHQEFTGMFKPNLVDWGVTSGPKETIPAGPSMTTAYRTYYGNGLAYLTTICRDAFAVHALAASNPLNPAVIEGRSMILSSLAFGGPPTLTGSWWVQGGGWNLNFGPGGQVVSHGWGDVAHYGSFGHSADTLTLTWRATKRPPVEGSCKASLTHVQLVLNCAGQSWTFLRSER